MVDAWRIVIVNPKIRSGFQPQIIGKTWMGERRIEVHLRVRRIREERTVDIRS